MNADEASIALAEYRPFNLMDQIPKTTEILYLDSAKDAAGAAADWFVETPVTRISADPKSERPLTILS